MEIEDVDQLTPAEPDAPGLGLRPLAWAAIALVGLVIGGVVVSQNHVVASNPLDSRPQPTANAPPRPVPTRGMAFGLAQNLTIGVICPTRPSANQKDTIGVSFELTNWGQQNVVVVDVAPRAPVRGLHQRGPVTAGGSCAQPSENPVGGVIMSGESELFTLWFAAPEGCPASSRRVDLELRANQLVGMTTVAVRKDVGKLTVSTCPTVSAG
jgi:hypothetical protein